LSSRNNNVQLSACNGRANQKWEYQGSSIVNPASGLCLEMSATAGDNVQAAECSGGINQEWL
jgi:hypothetical protein